MVSANVGGGAHRASTHHDFLYTLLRNIFVKWCDGRRYVRVQLERFTVIGYLHLQLAKRLFDHCPSCWH
jgi:hypothetical protein